MGKTDSNGKLKMGLMCLACVFLWGTAYTAIKLSFPYWDIAGSDIEGKLYFVGIRMMISGAVMTVIALVRQKGFQPISKKTATGVVLKGVETAFQYGLLYAGLAFTSGSKGAVLNQTSGFMLVLLTPLFFRNEKLGKYKVIGCVLGFAGILVLNLNGFSLSLELGDPLVILSSCFACIGYIILKKLPHESDPIQCTGYQQLLGGGLMFLLGIIIGGKMGAPNLFGVLTLLYLVLVSTVADGLWFYLLQHYEIGKVSAFKFLTPIIGVISACAILHENFFKIENIIALLLVSLGVVFVNLKATKKKTKNATVMNTAAK